MIDERTRRAHEVLVGALDLEGADRAGYVESACAGDAALRGDVDRLLAAARTSAGFLESPALGTGGTPAVRGYRIVRILGMGGMATVYEAEQESPRRRVALKVMHVSLARTSALQRFRFETEVLARLKHPGIAQIYEAGLCDGPGPSAPFFAMEFVEDAKAITSHAKDRGLGLRDRLLMFADVCDAVQHGHQLGVIHRDLKPGNVLVDGTGRIKVIDFGIARPLEAGGERITRHDGEALIGTLNAMSPEQCAGEGRIDTRTDVYALGVILYELVTGRLPHDLSRAPVPEAVRIIQSVEPSRPGTLAPAARGDLEAIILKAMDKEPGRRYDGAGSLASDVHRFLESKTVQARLPSALHHARLFARRHTALVIAVNVIALTIVGASALSAWFGYRSLRDSARRADAERTALNERDTARRQAYSAGIASAYLSYQAGEFSRGRQRLEAAPEALRGWEWSLISALLESGETVVHAHDDMVYAMDTAPDAGRLATASRDGGLALWSVDGVLMSRTPALAGSGAHSVALAPDARAVYAGYQDGWLREWAPETGVMRDIADCRADVRSLALAPTGLLAVACSDGAGSIVDPATGAAVHTFSDQPGGVHGACFSGDGARIATWNFGGSVWARDGATWEPALRLDFGGRPETAAWSPDGTLLAAAGGEGRLMVWAVPGGEVILNVGGSSSDTSVISLAFSSDGRRLFVGKIDRTILELAIDGSGSRLVGRHDEAVSALHFEGPSERLISASWDGTMRFWPPARGAEPGAMRAIPGHDGHILSMSFSPSGDLLATAGRDDVVRLWEPTLGMELAVLTGHSADISSVRFSPDGRCLASASVDGTVRLWSALNGECETVLGPKEGGVFCLAFSPDGASLAAGGDGSVTIWDVASSTPRLAIAAHAARVNSVAIDPSGTVLVSCSRDGSVILWDVASGQRLRTLGGHKSDVFASLFSPDGERLFTGSRDQTVRVWETRTGRPLGVLDCRGQFITSLSIDAGGKRLAAGSWFAEITLWDLDTLETVFSFRGNNAAIRALAFSPTEPVLFCAGHDGVLTSWSARTAEGRREAAEQAHAGMTAGSERLGELSAREVVGEEQGDAQSRSWLRKAALAREAARRTPRP